MRAALPTRLAPTPIFVMLDGRFPSKAEMADLTARLHATHRLQTVRAADDRFMVVAERRAARA